MTAVKPAPDGKTIYVVHRCFENSCEGRSEDPILKFDYSGRLLASFGQGLFLFPHGATVDHEGNLWVTDARSNEALGNQVIKFSPEGEILMTLTHARAEGVGVDSAGNVYGAVVRRRMLERHILRP